MRFYIKILPLLIATLFFHYLIKYKVNLQVEGNILEIYFSLFGSIYAIVIGFVLLVIITHHNNIKRFISSEVNAIQDLRDFLHYIDGDDQSVERIKEKVKSYVSTIIKTEWTQLKTEKPIHADTSVELYEIIAIINEITIRPNDLSDKIAVKKLINTVGHITTYRTNRLTSLNEKLPPVMIQLIFVLSLCIVLPFSVLPVDGIVWFFFNVVNIFSVAYIFFIIGDLNNPFGGYWSISNHQYELLLQNC